MVVRRAAKGEKLETLDGAVRALDPSDMVVTDDYGPIGMGGFGTWSLGLKHPDRFAAIAPICGGGDVLPLLLPDPAVAKRLKQLPVWAFHGGKDTAVKLEESERMVSELKRLGNAFPAHGEAEEV